MANIQQAKSTNAKIDIERLTILVLGRTHSLRSLIINATTATLGYSSSRFHTLETALRCNVTDSRVEYLTDYLHLANPRSQYPIASHIHIR
jgi:hypothetical protein